MTMINATPARSIPTPNAVFTLTIFVSAMLLFFVQPMYAKLLLPYLGGAAAVWTTAMLFFQSALLLGYLYAHLSVRFLPPGVQVALHLGLMLAAMLFLPLSIPVDWLNLSESAPVKQTLTLLALGVGLPFAVLSANAPLIQAWFSRAAGAEANPYSLYAASNLGSFLALLAFPLVAEPLLGGREIAWGWAAGFIALAGLLGICGRIASSVTNLGSAANGRSAATIEDEGSAGLTPRRIGLWLLLAFLPSSMMLSTTETIATDVGSFPLLWVLPLSLYLLSYVISFSDRSRISTERWAQLFVVAFAATVLLVGNGLVHHAKWSAFAVILAHFFLCAVLSHRLLYEARPAPQHLTLFYVFVSVGGVCGGIFNALIAPQIFSGVYEAPILIGLSALLLVRAYPGARLSLQAGLGLAFGAAVALPFLFSGTLGFALNAKTLLLISAAILLVALAKLSARGLALSLMAMIWFAVSHFQTTNDVMLQARSFFGTYRVRDAGDVRRLIHGTTVHGAWRPGAYMEGSDRPLPISYYHPNGPMGQILSSSKADRAERIGIVGLGVGALACFKQPHQSWSYYEIDPVVDQIARNPEFFPFMSACAGDERTKIGDARLVLEREAGQYDILVLDAYSSDAVPVHLLTQEAFRIYLDRLAPDGILVLHISNRFYSLSPVLARAAEHHGLHAWLQSYAGSEEQPLAQGEEASSVVVMAREEAGEWGSDEPRWKLLESDGKAVWTDDHANILAQLH